MVNIRDEIFKTIDTITDAKLNKIKFDRTIEAIVVDDSNSSECEYKLKYQDIEFFAYTINNTTLYKVGDNVFTLIPENNMNKRKTILCISKKNGEDFYDLKQTVADIAQNVEDINLANGRIDEANNAIGENKKNIVVAQKDIAQNTTDISLANENIKTNMDNILEANEAIKQSAEKLDKTNSELSNVLDRLGRNFVIDSKNFKIELTSRIINIDLDKENLIKEMNNRQYLVIGAMFLLDIKKNESFNLVLKCKDINNNIVLYEFKLSDIPGDNKNTNGTYKYKEIILPLDKQIKSIVDCYIEGVNFSNNNARISIKNLIIECADSRYQPVYSGGIKCEKGTFFQAETANNEDMIPLKMEFRKDGEILDTSAVEYRWFSLGTTARNVSAWKIISENRNGYVMGVNTSTLKVSSKYVVSFTTFKCEATYKNNTVVDTITIADFTDEIVAVITSSNGTSFIDGLGSTVLRTFVYRNNKNIASEIDKYEWISSKDGVETVTETKTGELTISANSIGNKTIYTCSALKLDEETNSYIPVARGTITLVNVFNGERGEQGESIKSITPQYYLSQSNTTLVGGSWKDNPDAWKKNSYIWERFKIVYYLPNVPNSETEQTTKEILNPVWAPVNSATTKLDNLLATDTGTIAKMSNKISDLETKVASLEEKVALLENDNERLYSVDRTIDDLVDIINKLISHTNLPLN
ncbi:MAG: hypothetical protein HUJ68_11995 [Clostridia bacterium]|nr:hypothetical protein [Clostridia bacterium]